MGWPRQRGFLSLVLSRGAAIHLRVFMSEGYQGMGYWIDVVENKKISDKWTYPWGSEWPWDGHEIYTESRRQSKDVKYPTARHSSDTYCKPLRHLMIPPDTSY